MPPHDEGEANDDWKDSESDTDVWDPIGMQAALPYDDDDYSDKDDDEEYIVAHGPGSDLVHSEDAAAAATLPPSLGAPKRPHGATPNAISNGTMGRATQKPVVLKTRLRDDNGVAVKVFCCSWEGCAYESSSSGALESYAFHVVPVCPIRLGDLYLCVLVLCAICGRPFVAPYAYPHWRQAVRVHLGRCAPRLNNQHAIHTGTVFCANVYHRGYLSGCKYAAAQSGHLTAHMRKHTGERLCVTTNGTPIPHPQTLP